MSTSIYLAGKIAKNDWRHDLVPRLRGHTWADGAIETNAFRYTGPFFVSCDHGCNHKPSSHGATAGSPFDESSITRSEVFKQNMAAIDAADLIFAYISSTDCHGTLVELGWALHAQKRVILAFAPSIPVDDFWYASHSAERVHIDVKESHLLGLLTEALWQYKQPRSVAQTCHKWVIGIECGSLR
jgi:hypothetical protein